MKMSGSCRMACTVPSAMACQYFNRLTIALLIGPDQEIGDVREWARLGCVDCSIDLGLEGRSPGLDLLWGARTVRKHLRLGLLDRAALDPGIDLGFRAIA